MTADVNVQTANVRAWSAVTGRRKISVGQILASMKDHILEVDGTPA